MAYPNLRAELAKKDITFEEIADLLEIHRNSVANKIKGPSRFSIEEASKIYKKYFKDSPISMDELFENAT